MTGAAELTRRLGGRWHGRYGIAHCIVHRDENPSLSIIDGERGPILKCFAGCDWRNIRDELRHRGFDAIPNHQGQDRVILEFGVGAGSGRRHHRICLGG